MLIKIERDIASDSLIFLVGGMFYDMLLTVILGDGRRQFFPKGMIGRYYK